MLSIYENQEISRCKGVGAHQVTYSILHLEYYSYVNAMRKSNFCANYNFSIYMLQGNDNHQVC